MFDYFVIGSGCRVGGYQEEDFRLTTAYIPPTKGNDLWAAPDCVAGCSMWATHRQSLWSIKGVHKKREHYPNLSSHRACTEKVSLASFSEGSMHVSWWQGSYVKGDDEEPQLLLANLGKLIWIIRDSRRLTSVHFMLRVLSFSVLWIVLRAVYMLGKQALTTELHP